MPVADRPPLRRKRARRRAPWGSISRAQILEAATEAVRRGEFDQMTIRSLAGELGVSPMSLYRHVRDKDDILDEVVDRLLERVWRPRGHQADLRLWITQAAERLRDLLVREPAVLYVYLRRPVVSPAAVARMEAMIEVLRSAGLDREGAREAYATIHTYTVGFAALEGSRDRWVPSNDPSQALARELASFTTPKRFTEGLGYLLDGIERTKVVMR